MQFRDRLGLPVVSLVGYTNAGKSTIFNRLSSAGVLAEDKLFATLDPIARRVKLSMPTCDTIDTNNVHAALKYRDIMLTDTVGFISKLPAHLVAAFRFGENYVLTKRIFKIICEGPL
jgi:GTP-binding protein HflX